MFDTRLTSSKEPDLNPLYFFDSVVFDFTFRVLYPDPTDVVERRNVELVVLSLF